jgi:hypothetical protein
LPPEPWRFSSTWSKRNQRHRVSSAELLDDLQQHAREKTTIDFSETAKTALQRLVCVSDDSQSGKSSVRFLQSGNLGTLVANNPYEIVQPVTFLWEADQM